MASCDGRTSMLLLKCKVISTFEQQSALVVQAVLKCGIQAESCCEVAFVRHGHLEPSQRAPEASGRLILLLESAPEPKRIFILTLGRREWGGRCRGKGCEEIKGTGLG